MSDLPRRVSGIVEEFRAFGLELVPLIKEPDQEVPKDWPEGSIKRDTHVFTITNGDCTVVIFFVGETEIIQWSVKKGEQVRTRENCNATETPSVAVRLIASALGLQRQTPRKKKHVPPNTKTAKKQE